MPLLGRLRSPKPGATDHLAPREAGAGGGGDVSKTSAPETQHLLPVLCPIPYSPAQSTLKDKKEVPGLYLYTYLVSIFL